MYKEFAVLFALMFTGYALRKIGIFGEKIGENMNGFIIYFAYPCLLVYKIGTMEIERALAREFIYTLVFGTLFFVVYAILAKLYVKKRKFPNRIGRLAEVAMVCPNNGFLGFPVAMVFFGERGLLLMTAHNVAMYVYIFSYGIITLKEDDQGKNLKEYTRIILKILVNPNIVAIIIGFLISVYKLPLQGSFIGGYLENIGYAASPMAMILVGSTLYGNNLIELLKNHIIWESAIMKLFILPALTILMVMPLPVGIETKAILVLGISFPSAALVSMLSEGNDANVSLASKILFFTTVLSMGTIPIVVKVLEVIF